MVCLTAPAARADGNVGLFFDGVRSDCSERGRRPGSLQWCG